MTNFTRMPHSVTAAIGALFISTLFVVAAVGPVHASDMAHTTTAQVQPSAQAHA